MQEKICQSCAMPIENDTLYGTNADGSKNPEYCKYCWVKGQFGNPNETMQEMIDSCVAIIVKEEGLEEEKVRTMLNKAIPKLKRWQNS